MIAEDRLAMFDEETDHRPEDTRREREDEDDAGQRHAALAGEIFG